MSAQTELILITGFLGAGKTTFLNRLLTYFKDLRIGIIVNDFGEVAVDGDLIRANPSVSLSRPEQLIEIANGSIFCSCLQTAFLDGLTHYSRQQPDLLLIETSGMSDPSSMGRLLASETRFQAAFRLAATYCLIDAVSFLGLADHFLFIENQVLASDIAVISKTEQTAPEVLPIIHAKLRSFQPEIQILTSTESDAVLFDTAAIRPEIRRSGVQPLQSLQKPPLFHGCQAVARPHSFFLDQKPLILSAATHFFNQIQTTVYRVKGFLQIGTELYNVDGTNGEITLRSTLLKPARLGVSVFAAAAMKATILRDWSML